MKNVKIFLLGIFFTLSLSLIFASKAEARSIRVRGYTRKSTGRYVMPSYRTSPNRYKFDNFSAKGNYNPYSGRVGTKSWW
jgi:hypothetical protein